MSTIIHISKSDYEKGFVNERFFSVSPLGVPKEEAVQIQTDKVYMCYSGSDDVAGAYGVTLTVKEWLDLYFTHCEDSVVRMKEGRLVHKVFPQQNGDGV
jgi:hypothetical protein